MRYTLIMLVLALLSAGCTGSLEREAETAASQRKLGAPTQADPARCGDIDDSRWLWGASAKSSAVVAGGLGGSGLMVEELRTDKAARIGMAAGALTAAAWAAFSLVMQEGKGEQWARDCSGR